MQVLLRYKDDRTIERSCMGLNTHAMNEVLTGDDTVFFHEMEVRLPSGEWKCLLEALRDKDLIANNLNTDLAFPKTPEDKERGYYY